VLGVDLGCICIGIGINGCMLICTGCSLTAFINSVSVSRSYLKDSLPSKIPSRIKTADLMILLAIMALL